jgi:hypothetical protein
MRNKDVIYASNAESVEVVKFIAYANYLTAGVAAFNVTPSLYGHRQGARFLRANER